MIKVGDLVRGTSKDEYSYNGTGVVLHFRQMKCVSSDDRATIVCLLDSKTGEQYWVFESALTRIETDE